MPRKTKDNIEQAIVCDYSQGFGVMELANMYELNRCTIQRILKRNNIVLRKRAPVHYNVNFFDDYNINSCYWAGFIASDGYVRSDRNAVSIHLSNLDIDHLRKISTATNFLGNIHSYEHDCYVSFAGEWFKNALADNFDIFPRKTFDVQISNKIPNDMIVHFLRGYFDGDGCITSTEGYLRINFSSGSTGLLNQIVEYIYDNGVRVRNECGKPKISNDCLIAYSCENAYKILDMLYSGSTELTRLNRKYDLYLRWKQYEQSRYQ